MQLVSRRIESTSKMKANARVSFVVNQKSILGNCVSISERFFTDLKSAKTASLAEAFLTTLYLGIAQDEQEGYAKDTWLKISQTGPGISPDVSKNISKLTASGEGMVNPYLVQYGTDELPNITELNLHNPMDSALKHLHLYKNLTSLTIDNSSLQELRESEATFNLDYRTIPAFSDASFVHLEKCPNLTALSLVNVETVSTIALVALCQKSPLLKIQSTFEKRPITILPPSSSAAEVGFVVRKYTFKDGHYSILRSTTRTYEQASDIYNKTWDSIGRSLYAMLKTASGIQEIRIQRDMAQIIDSKQVRAATVDGIWDEDSVKRPMDYFIGTPNLQDLTLCNVTKNALMSFRKLSQVKTLTINNSSFKEVITRAIQRAGAKPSALERINDDTLFALKDAKKLKKITLIGCKDITDAAISYVNTTKKGSLTVERRVQG